MNITIPYSKKPEFTKLVFTLLEDGYRHITVTGVKRDTLYRRLYSAGKFCSIAALPDGARIDNETWVMRAAAVALNSFPGWFTTAEFANAYGENIQRARYIIRDFLESGLIERRMSNQGDETVSTLRYEYRIVRKAGQE